MTPARAIIKNSIFGLLALSGALFIFLTFVPDRYWPMHTCNIATLNEVASPSKTMVARYVRTNCESKQGEMESTVFVGTLSKAPGQLVFISPGFIGGGDQKQSIDLQMTWKSEDHLEISYPDDIIPTLPGYEFRAESFTVKVTSVSQKMASNQSLQSGRK